MTTMRSLNLPAFAKLNLGLQVVGPRADGFHELRTVLQTVSLHDTLSFTPHPKGLALECRAAGVPSGEENLVLRAARAFERARGRKVGVRIRLTKRIPAQAGLGGGSSDAAVTLAGLNTLCGKPLHGEALMELAGEIGSDVPFFLTGGTALCLGRGEIVRPLEDFESGPILILLPDFRVSTAAAFRRVDASLTPRRGKISIYRFSRQWVRGSAAFVPAPNDLERAVAPEHPLLARALKWLRALGATATAMTGSGSAVYGHFAGERKARRALTRLTGSSRVSRAWIVRTIGAKEYGSRVLS